jgi:restriction endonuclease Mrr
MISQETQGILLLIFAIICFPIILWPVTYRILAWILNLKHFMTDDPEERRRLLKKLEGHDRSTVLRSSNEQLRDILKFYEQIELNRQEAERKAEIERIEVEKQKSINLKKYEYLISLSPQQFEDTISELFKKLGYSIKQTPYSSDGGVDIIATHAKKKYVIECKRYSKDNLVGRRDIQILHASKIDNDAESAIFVTTSDFTNDAYQYAQRHNIRLINGEDLISIF